jgi:hypothetical protein
MSMTSSIDLPMTPVNSGGVRASHRLMEKANFSLAEHETMKKQEKSERMERRCLDCEARSAERSDQCDDGSEFDDPEVTQLLS